MSSRKKVKKELLTHNIPEDIILTNIISRLPAKDVNRFRCVRKSWNDFLATRNFKELHLRYDRPLLLVLDMNNRYKPSPFLISKWWDFDHIKPTIHKLTNFPRARIVLVDDGFSLDGLIVLKESSFGGRPLRNFIIFNPIYANEVRVRLPRNFFILSDIYAAFYNPVLKEYCTLWRLVDHPKKSSLEKLRVKYMLLNLGPEPRWREIYNPWSCNKYVIFGTFPVYANGSIYWEVNGNKIMLKSIMVYEIIPERFALIPYPNELNNEECFLFNIRFMNIDGLPSLVHIYETHGCALHINIWTLKNNGEPFWTRSSYYAVAEEGSLRGDFLKPIVVVNGTLAFHNGKRIFLCFLKLGIIIVYGREKYNMSVEFWSHVPSFIPLYCPSPIFLEPGIFN